MKSDLSINFLAQKIAAFSMTRSGFFDLIHARKFRQYRQFCMQIIWTIDNSTLLPLTKLPIFTLINTLHRQFITKVMIFFAII